jgi:Fic family protein
MDELRLFGTPEIDLQDVQVLDEVAAMRVALADLLRVPRRWSGGLRRTTQARAIRGSNTIEGYTVSAEDAVAAVDEEPPMSADERTWAEIIGYRRVLTYILRMAPDPGFSVDSQVLRSLHFMLLEHDLAKDPGRFRAGTVYVQDESSGEMVYEGPDAGLVPRLVDQLAETLNTGGGEPMVDAAMAHLNLVMIHPFRDGNGRVARALQTLVMARDQVLEPTFSSIEEWLGANTQDYYRVLALTGGGSWSPGNDAGLWVKFNLRAHHMQAQTLQRRFAEAEATWTAIDALITEHGLPERVGDALFDAILGYRVRRPGYLKRAGIEQRTATRDLNQLVTAGLLDAVGQTRGRYYTASPRLHRIAMDTRSVRPALTDPYPWLPARLRG